MKIQLKELLRFEFMTIVYLFEELKHVTNWFTYVRYLTQRRGEGLLVV